MIYKKALLFIILISITCFIGVEAVEAKSGEQPDAPEITGISVQEVDGATEIKIDSDSPFSYTIYKPADPYRLIVELQEVEMGKFKDNIIVDRAGVMEIIPSKSGSVGKGVKLEIILTAPVDVKPVQKENSLILSFNNPEAGGYGEVSEKEAVPAHGGTAEEALKDAEMIEKIELIKAHGKVFILIQGDGKMHPEAFQPEGNRIIVDIPGVSTSVESPKLYEPPVLGVRVGKQPDKTRIVIDLAGAVNYDISSEGKQVYLSFDIPEAKTTGEAVTQPAEEPAATTVTGTTAESRQNKYAGEVISIDIQDAPLSKIFAILAEVSGYNIILSPQVKDQKVFIKLNNVPWDHALSVILRNYGLSKSVEGNIMRIAPTDIITQEELAIAQAKEAALKSGDLETRMYPINFAEVTKLKDLLEDVREEKGGGGGARERGSISVDARTNTIIIRDVARMHEEYEKVIRKLDTPTRQVSIDAKIVEVTKNFTQQLGIQWGALVKPTPQTVIGGTGASQGTGFSSGNPLLINLPAAVGAGAGGSLGFGYIGADSLRSLDIQLSAMESSNNGKVISNPKIITLDHQQASIEQGVEIPFQTTSNAGTQTTFKSASLKLTVTPHITPNGIIVMDVNTTKDEPVQCGSATGDPCINKNEAKSQVLIKDSDTLVMGGIFTTNESEDTSYVPLLGKIPILGWLFKKKIDGMKTTELLIFITPRIIN